MGAQRVPTCEPSLFLKRAEAGIWRQFAYFAIGTAVAVPLDMESSHRLRVLYLDDDDSVRQAFGRALRRTFDVDSVADAPSAEAAVASQHYDAFVTDLNMPDVDGFGAIARVTAIDPRLGHHALILTGSYFTPSYVAELNAKGHRMAFKTCTLEELRTAVLDCIGDGSRDCLVPAPIGQQAAESDFELSPRRSAASAPPH